MDRAASAPFPLHRRRQRIVRRWTNFSGFAGAEGRSIDLILFGAAASVVLSLIAQIGEQVDFLRFLPPERRATGLVGRLSAAGRAGSCSAR